MIRTQRWAAILWIINLQYFIVQIIAAAAWKQPFSLRSNYISDLGNTVCGSYSDRAVCSPDHLLMNISFVLLGLTQLAGALLLIRVMKAKKFALFGYSTLALAGVGTIFVGLFPENTIAAFHTGGAVMPFFFGNFAAASVAIGSKWMPKWLSGYSYLSSFIGLTALALFLSGNYGWLQGGGMERLVAYPQTIWMIVVGAYLYLKSQKLFKKC